MKIAVFVFDGIKYQRQPVAMNSLRSDPRETGRSSGPWYARDSTPPAAGHTRNRRPRTLITIVTAGAAAVLAAIAAVIIIAVAPAGKGSTAGFVPTGSSPDEDGEQITAAFLSAWKAGNLRQAARYTDHPAAAEAALAAYGEDLHLRKLRGSPQRATVLTASTSSPRVSVEFTVNAMVAAHDSATAPSGTWRYHVSLVAYQRQNSRAWYISWAPEDLAPNLTASTHLAAVSAPPQIVSVNDTSGNRLTSYGDPGLNRIAGILQDRPPAGQGRSGLYVEIQTAKDKLVPNSQAVVLAPATVPGLTTTINATAEKAARSAVAEHRQSSIVAIQPSTGRILAIANNDGYNNFALTAAVAPGSTGKIISSTALLTKGVLSAHTPVACPAVFTVQGVNYHNDNGESEPASTPLSYDFAQSCNTAFARWWPHAANGGLAATAKKYYGLDEPWDIGIGDSATYYEQPASASGSELAENMFGEGAITASPLAMASVAATVEDGSFKQPVIVPGAKRVAAAPLPAGVDSQLKEMMRDVVTEGTAAGLGFGPDVYAKTGTADINGQEQPNSWLVAFDPGKDVAVACLVVDAGYGAQYAAPEAAHFLGRY